MEWLGGGGWRKNCNKLPTAPLQDKHPGPETEARVTIIEGRKRLSILPQHWDGIVHLSRVSRKAKVQLAWLHLRLKNFVSHKRIEFQKQLLQFAKNCANLYIQVNCFLFSVNILTSIKKKVT